MTPREKVLRDFVEKLVADEYTPCRCSCAAKSAARVLAAADAISDAPASCGHGRCQSGVCWIAVEEKQYIEKEKP